MDFTTEQRDKARSLAQTAGLAAAKQELYLRAIESAGFTIEQQRANAYEFISEQARNASARCGVKSISLLATLPTNQSA